MAAMNLQEFEITCRLNALYAISDIIKFLQDAF